MNDLRTAAQQALEALEQDNPAGRAATITALRAALAQEQGPFAPDALRKTQTAWQMGYDAAKAEQPAPEPVAWMTHGKDPLPLFHKTKAGAEAWGAEPQPLYTTPPQRPLLTVTDLQQALVDTGLIFPEAIDDAEGFDNGVTLERIDSLHAAIERAVRGEA